MYQLVEVNFGGFNLNRKDLLQGKYFTIRQAYSLRLKSAQANLFTHISWDWASTHHPTSIKL
jgi:hypothetical protein